MCVWRLQVSKIMCWLVCSDEWISLLVTLALDLHEISYLYKPHIFKCDLWWFDALTYSACHFFPPSYLLYACSANYSSRFHCSFVFYIDSLLVLYVWAYLVCTVESEQQKEVISMFRKPISQTRGFNILILL